MAPSTPLHHRLSTATAIATDLVTRAEHDGIQPRRYLQPRPPPGAMTWVGVALGCLALAIILGLAAWASIRSRREARAFAEAEAARNSLGPLAW